MCFSIHVFGVIVMQKNEATVNSILSSWYCKVDQNLVEISLYSQCFTPVLTSSIYTNNLNQNFKFGFITPQDLLSLILSSVLM